MRKAAGDDVARRALRGLYSLCDLYPTPPVACLDALDSGIPDYEDAVQIETARQNACDLIVTRNLRDYEDSSVPYIDPTGLLAFMGIGKFSVS